ncbi:hypothetical protein R5R35_005605 [Gryllus longicercus]|uniref:Uncharacterized protein n=1 Tax=Gryllus longicercus TaxID=2509291 RepID=A0AAN9VDP4_9ORTH
MDGQGSCVRGREGGRASRLSAREGCRSNKREPRVGGGGEWDPSESGAGLGCGGRAAWAIAVSDIPARAERSRRRPPAARAGWPGARRGAEGRGGARRQARLLARRGNGPAHSRRQRVWSGTRRRLNPS